jgi:hypothetical protein
MAADMADPSGSRSGKARATAGGRTSVRSVPRLPRWNRLRPIGVTAELRRHSEKDGVAMERKRCEVKREDGIWQVAFFGGDDRPPLTKVFPTEAKALLAVSEWCGTERSNGHGIDLSLPPIDDRRYSG